MKPKDAPACPSGSAPTDCPQCGFSAEGIRCPRCFTLKVHSCSGGCSGCGPKKKEPAKR